MKYELNVSSAGEQAFKQLADQGIIVGRSVDLVAPELPSDITNLGDEELMELFTAQTSYMDFLSFQTALAQIDEREAEKKMDAAIAVATANQPKGLAAVIKATALADPKVAEISYDHSIKYNYRKIIEAMAANVERDMYLVSRELTRRTSSGSVMTRSRKFVS
jgi:hypothetical protein